MKFTQSGANLTKVFCVGVFFQLFEDIKCLLLEVDGILVVVGLGKDLGHLKISVTNVFISLNLLRFILGLMGHIDVLDVL